MADRRRTRVGAVLLTAAALVLGPLPALADHPPSSVPAYDWACDGSAPEDGFTDVTPGNVHEAAIDCAVAHGLAKGTSATTYAPSTAVTRAQLATFVARLLPTDELTGERPPPDAFDDDEGSLHEPAIDRLAALGVVQGTGPRTFSPDATVTRAQMAAYLVRAWQHQHRLQLPQARDRFTDDEGSTHERVIDQVAAMGISSGATATTYQPANAVRRDQMARFLVNALGCLRWWPRGDGQHHAPLCDSYTETDGAAALQSFEVEVVTDAEHYTAGQPVGVAVRACNRRSTVLEQVFPQRAWFALEARSEHEVLWEGAPPYRQWYDHRWPSTLDGSGYGQDREQALHDRVGEMHPVLTALTWFDGPQSGPDEVVTWQAGECKSLDVGAWGQHSKDVFVDIDRTDYPAQWRTVPAPYYRTEPGWHVLRLSWGGVEVGQARRYLTVDARRVNLDGPKVTADFPQRRYAPGEQVPITVRACNHSDRPYDEHVGRRDTTGEVEVFRVSVQGNYDDSAAEIGSVSANGSDRQLSWAPGECKTWELSWDQRFEGRERVEHEQVVVGVSWNPQSDERLQEVDGEHGSLD